MKRTNNAPRWDGDKWTHRPHDRWQTAENHVTKGWQRGSGVYPKRKCPRGAGGSSIPLRQGLGATLG